MQDKRRDSKGRILRNGEVQRRDGQYMYRYTDLEGNRQSVYSWKLVETDKVPDGKKSGVSLREMEKQIARCLETGVSPINRPTSTVNDLFNLFMSTRTDLRTSTKCNYTFLYNKHVAPYIGNRRASAIRYTDIRTLYSKLSSEEGLSVSTIRGIHSIVYQTFESAVLDNLLRANPSSSVFKSFRKTISQESKDVAALTEEQQVAFLSYVRNSRTYKRWLPLFTTLLCTGLRIGEALGLRWCDCDFKNNNISVNHALAYKTTETSGYEFHIIDTKTRSGVRNVPMMSEVKKVLLAEKRRKKDGSLPVFTVDGYTGFIFLNSAGKVFTPGAVFDTIQNIVYDHNKDEELKAQKENRPPCYLPKFSAHVLRHTFCTRLCEQETNLKTIQAVMGHKNARTTLGVYTDTNEKRNAETFISLEGKIKLF